MDHELRGLRATFYEEAAERLLELESLLLALERRDRDPDLLNSIFRAVHSIKGGSAACEHVELTRFAHVYESLLDSLRKGHLSVDSRLLDVMLQAKDVLDALVVAAREHKEDREHEAVADAVAAIRQQLATIGATVEEADAVSAEGGGGLVIWDDEPELADARRASMARPSLHADVLRASASPPSETARRSMPARASSAPRRSPGTQAPAAATGVRDTHSVSTSKSTRSVSPGHSKHSVSPANAQHSVSRRAPGVGTTRAADVQFDGVVVRVGQQLYVLPTEIVESFHQPAPEALRDVPTQGQLLLTIHGTLPLLRLDELLGAKSAPGHVTNKVAVLCRAAGRHIALLVDEVLLQGSLPMMSLRENLGDVRGVLGAVLIEEQLALVLDPLLLAKV